MPGTGTGWTLPTLSEPVPSARVAGLPALRPVTSGTASSSPLPTIKHIKHLDFIEGLQWGWRGSECASLTCPTRYVPHTNNRLMYTNHIVFPTDLCWGASPSKFQPTILLVVLLVEIFDTTRRCWPPRRSLISFSTRRGGSDLPVVSLMLFSMRRGGSDPPVTSLIIFRCGKDVLTSPSRYWTFFQRDEEVVPPRCVFFKLIMYLYYIILYLFHIPVSGFTDPRVWWKPVPQPVETRTRTYGYGFARVRVRVALGNPRVTRDNP